MFLTVFILFVCALIAFTLSAVCGGGASFILIPLLGLILPGSQIPAALSVGTASSSLSRLTVLWNNIRWDLVKWFIPPAIPAVWLGARLLTYINPLFLELLLGIFLLWNITFLFKKQQAQKPSPQKHLIVFVVGLLTGFISGITGAVGLIFNRFYLTYGLTKQEIVATRAANEVILHIIKLFLYASFGLLTNKSLIYGGLIALAGIISSLSIKYVLPLISESIFQKIGYGAMVISGIVLFSGAVKKIQSSGNLRISLLPISNGLETQVQWKTAQISLEFEYDEGLEIEQRISLEELPQKYLTCVTPLINKSDSYIIEAVNGIGKHYYELYIWRSGKLSKYDLK